MINKINAYFEKEKENMLKDLASLIEIPSVLGEKEVDAPFGKEPKRALLKMLEIAERDGFKTNNIDNYAGEIDLNDDETTLAILGHLDVVPEGDGWTLDPYKMVEKDGKVYGRGTSDDKGPVIAAFYALKAVREMGIALKNNVRLIVGTNEETGSGDIEYYVTKRKMPPMVFTPDSSFPVTNVERGRFSKEFTAKFNENKEKGVVSFDGGFVSNAVPSKAQATLKGYSENEILKVLETVSSETNIRFSLTQNNDLVTILAEGTSAHASTPEMGNNPITALIYAVSKICGDAMFCNLSKLFPHGKFHGEGLGVNMEDEISGPLTMSLDILKTENGAITGCFDSRIPLCATKENLAYKVRDELGEIGFALSDTDMVPVHYVDENSEFVKKLLNAYETFTGEKGYCEKIGGGTYVHEIEGGVAFGAVMPNTDTNMHGADEFMPIDELLIAAKIFTYAIIDILS